MTVTIMSYVTIYRLTYQISDWLLKLSWSNRVVCYSVKCAAEGRSNIFTSCDVLCLFTKASQDEKVSTLTLQRFSTVVCYTSILQNCKCHRNAYFQCHFSCFVLMQGHFNARWHEAIVCTAAKVITSPLWLYVSGRRHNENNEDLDEEANWFNEDTWAA